MIDYDLKQIRAVMFDVDGVLSRETVTLSAEGLPMRTVNIKDGYAIQLAVKLGLTVCIISGATCEAVEKRYRGLGVKDVCMGSSVKIEVFKRLLVKHELMPDNVIFVGDDIPDYEVMKASGCGCCPSDAAPEIREVARYVSPYRGGEGCARDVLEQVLRAQGKWQMDEKAFGW
ncbi:MAG: HAD hydrolase family protein [Bacteroidaceae bacterium]|nr:HAD hydrolase family protein [Bacteroidaceae bacterium]